MVERTLPKPDTRVRFPSAAPQAPDLMVWGFIFRLDAVVGLGWTGRGGMFLAPAVGAKEVYSVRMGLQQTLSR